MPVGPCTRQLAGERCSPAEGHRCTGTSLADRVQIFPLCVETELRQPQPFCGGSKTPLQPPSATGTKNLAG